MRRRPLSPSPDQYHDGCRVEEDGGGTDGCLEVLREPPVAVDPGEETFDHTSSRQDDEAELAGLLADDFDDDAGGCRHPLMIVFAIDPYVLDERKQRARNLEERSCAIAILNVGRMRFDKERPPVAEVAVHSADGLRGW